LKHGLLAEASLLPGEDAALFRLLAEGGRKLAHLPRLALRDDAASKRRFAGAHLPYYEPGESVCCWSKVEKLRLRWDGRRYLTALDRIVRH